MFFECILTLLMADGTEDQLLVVGLQKARIMQNRTIDFSKHLDQLVKQKMIIPTKPVHTVNADNCMEVHYE